MAFQQVRRSSLPRSRASQGNALLATRPFTDQRSQSSLAQESSVVQPDLLPFLLGNAPAGPAIAAATPAQPQSALQAKTIDLDQTPVEAPTHDLPPPEQRRMIRKGSQGKEVSYAQERLNAHGAAPPLAVDGIFGPLTQQATVDYQTSHGLAVDSIIGPRTWASLDGPVSVGKKSGQGNAPNTPGTGKALEYDNTGYTIAPPSAPTKSNPLNNILQGIKAALQAKQDQKPQPDLGKTINVKGVTPGQPEEVFVWNVMLQLASHDRWGSETDVVTDIDWATGGAKAPVGQITLRIDAKGNATAELLQKGAVKVASTFNSIADAKTGLKTKFKFANVRDGAASWTLEELNKTHAALSKMPPDDQGALAGVDLVREHVLVDSSGNKLAGLFSHSAQLAQGAATPTRSDTLSLADLAFTSDNISFVGDKGSAEVGSFQTILHEAGHAVETKALRDARFAKMEAQGEQNQAIATLNAKIAAVNAAIQAFNTESTTAFGKAKSYSTADKKAAQSFLKALDAATKAINTFSNNNTVSQHVKLEASASAAISKRDTEQQKLTTAAATNPALTDFKDTMQRQDDWFKAAQERAKAHTAKKATDDKVAEKTKEENAVKGTGGQSKRLQNFVALVNKHKIPPLTDYAKSKWPGEPEEFFAEAYSLWLSDRSYLETNAQPIVDWFDQGNHLK